MTASLSVLDHALAYAARGWRVIPILQGVKYPKGFDDWPSLATTDRARIEGWLTDPKYGVGIVTGIESGIFVVDVDVSDGKHGDETLDDLVHEHGPLPDTVTSITGSRGLHLYFRMPDGVTITNDAGKRLGPGLDVRGEGGLVVAPPSVHPKAGRRYEWEVDHDPLDGIAVADAPAWLIDLLLSKPPPSEKARRTRSENDGTLPGDRYAAAHTWPELLIAAGWTLHSIHNGPDGYYELWTRPGKDVSEGCSASLYYKGSDVLKLFTPSAAPLIEGETYTKFGFYTALHHGGDFEAAARQLVRDGYGTPADYSLANLIQLPVDDTTVSHADTIDARDEQLRMLVDWPKFWQQDHVPEEWLARPLIPKGRSVSIHAPGGTGKSLLGLHIAVSKATGRSCLGEPPRPPIDVLYFDYEMTADDLHERLDAMGYGPDDDLSHLHYALLPMIPPLDTAEGGKAFTELAAAVNAQLCVIDTLARAVCGDENEADTVLAFYRFTGAAIKAAGRSLLRLDHTGKDPDKGARGTSAKRDDVDVVWRMTAKDGGSVELRAEKRRLPWVPEVVQLDRRTDDELVFVVRRGPEPQWLSGTVEVAALLDALDEPVTITKRAAAKALKEAGQGRSNALVLDAIRYRREHPKPKQLVNDVVPETPGPRAALGVGDRPPLGRDHSVNNQATDPGTMAGPPGPIDSSSGPRSPLSREGPGPDQLPDALDPCFTEEDAPHLF